MKMACARRKCGSRSVWLEYQARGRVVRDKAGEVGIPGSSHAWGHE